MISAAFTHRTTRFLAIHLAAISKRKEKKNVEPKNFTEIPDIPAPV